MEELKRTQEITYGFVSSDGCFRRSLYSSNPTEAELEEAKKAVREYEESAKYTIRTIAMGVPHVKYNGDDPKAAFIMGECYYDDTLYVFKIRNEDDLKAVVAFMNVDGKASIITQPYEKKHVKDDGTVQTYWSIFATSDYQVDFTGYVGKTFVVRETCDGENYFYGSVEECVKRTSFWGELLQKETSEIGKEAEAEEKAE